MNVLFICSGNHQGKVSPIIKNQADSLLELGVNIEFFTISQKGLKGYYKAIWQIRKLVKQKSFDIYHAHYGLSAIAATFAGLKPLFSSLMGSDIKEGGLQLFLLKWFSRKRWSVTITKSNELHKTIGHQDVKIIPNGVNMKKFAPMDSNVAKQKIGLKKDMRYVLFGSDPDRSEKNFKLAKEAFSLLKSKNIELIVLKNIENEEVPIYLNASEVVILTSLWEGSPNVIKEAMACCRPIVSTNVGDVSWLLEGVKGSFIAIANPVDFAEKIDCAIDFDDKTDGRSKLKGIGLDSANQAKTIKGLYELHKK